ncbi:MAG: hypothetical protein CMJ19_05550 [Phycisphaeraceae bacterium]|nr:hypothetical protein [Phycisphaeraceae bacterium]
MTCGQTRFDTRGSPALRLWSGYVIQASRRVSRRDSAMLCFEVHVRLYHKEPRRITATIKFASANMI